MADDQSLAATVAGLSVPQKAIIDTVAAGDLAEPVLDQAAGRVLRLVQRR